MAKLLGILSLLVFVLSALVHALTFVPGLPVSMKLAWPLHLAAIAVFAAMIFSVRNRIPKGLGPYKLWRWVLRRVPLPAILLCVAVAAYTAVNFSLFIRAMENGSPVEENGRYYLLSHGKKVRDLDNARYEQLRAYEVRGFSGHWMLFSVISTTFFFCVSPTIRSAEERENENDLGEAS